MTDIIYRAFAHAEPKVSKEKREATFSFASSYPVPRGFGLEVLGMDPENIDRERVDANNLPLLLNHDTGKAIGAVRDIWQSSGKSYARVKFSHVRDAEDLMADWDSQIRTGVSVGYRVLKMQRIKKGDAQQNEPDVFKALLWKPVEVSAGVPIPADHTVGPGRSESGDDCRYDGVEFLDENGDPLQVRHAGEKSLRVAAGAKSRLDQIRDLVIAELLFDHSRKEAGVTIDMLRVVDEFLRLPQVVRERVIKAK